MSPSIRGNPRISATALSPIVPTLLAASTSHPHGPGVGGVGVGSGGGCVAGCPHGAGGATRTTEGTVAAAAGGATEEAVASGAAVASAEGAGGFQGTAIRGQASSSLASTDHPCLNR